MSDLADIPIHAEGNASSLEGRPFHARARRRLRKIFRPARVALGLLPPGAAYVQCDRGHTHYGKFGGAGLLVIAVGRDDAGRERSYVLLAKRSVYVSGSGLWGIPGGARDRADEPLGTTALREAYEETGLDISLVRMQLGASPVGLVDHGGWSYTTYLGRIPTVHGLPAVAPGDFETAEVAWVDADKVASLPLHGGFAKFWVGYYSGNTVAARPTELSR